jgi:heme/copper-type cytochrome/quinol oxidase subunit 2
MTLATVLLLLGLLVLAAAPSATAQCAMCQGASAAGSDGGAVYNRSTLFMLCVPYLLLAGVAGYVVYAFRRARPAASAGNPNPAPPDSAVASSDAEQSQG